MNECVCVCVCVCACLSASMHSGVNPCVCVCVWVSVCLSVCLSVQALLIHYACVAGISGQMHGVLLWRQGAGWKRNHFGRYELGDASQLYTWQVGLLSLSNTCPSV